jgi:hypothetical protein
MATLAEIRAKLQAQEARRKGPAGQPAGDGQVFRHWNQPEGTTSTVRFLADANTNNPFFWVERQMITLNFAGVAGQDEHKPVTLQVPCVEMYDSKTKCPVHEIIRPWFKDPTREALGRKYWKKRSYIMSGFVVQSAVEEEEPLDNPIRRFVISPQIFTVIKSSLMDPDMEHLPTDIEMGTDFRINKTSKGGYADYSTSSWSRKERALSEAERAAVEEHGLYNLSDFLPKQPDSQHMQAILEMFEASVDGQMYDPSRWGQFYRPFGVEAETATAPRTATGPVVAAADLFEQVQRKTA